MAPACVISEVGADGRDAERSFEWMSRRQQWLDHLLPLEAGDSFSMAKKGCGKGRKLLEDEIGTLSSTAPQVMEALLGRSLSRRSRGPTCASCKTHLLKGLANGRVAFPEIVCAHQLGY